MPRLIYDVNGNDVSSSVYTTLRAGNTLVTQYLFRFQCVIFWEGNQYPNYCDFTFTDADFPIFINKYQIAPNKVSQLGTYHVGILNTDGLTFVPEKLQLDKLEYAVGFEDKPVQITWNYDDSVDYKGSALASLSVADSPSNLTLRRALLLGGLQDVPFWVHTALFTDFPDKGGTFLGTSLMFRGYIRNVESSRDALKFTISSLMDVFQSVQIPTQIITPNDRSGPFIPAIPGPQGGAATDFYTVISPVSLQLNSNFGTYTYDYNQLKDYYVSFQPFISGSNYPNGLLPLSYLPPPPLWRISGNEIPGVHSVILHFYTPPVIPDGSPFINIFGQSGFIGGAAPGFPYVPAPELVF